MAVPKRKTSTARRDRRRRSHWKLSAKSATRCPQCEAMMLAHRACGSCGQYQGHQVLRVKQKKERS